MSLFQSGCAEVGGELIVAKNQGQLDFIRKFAEEFSKSASIFVYFLAFALDLAFTIKKDG